MWDEIEDTSATHGSICVFYHRCFFDELHPRQIEETKKGVLLHCLYLFTYVKGTNLAMNQSVYQNDR